MGQPRRLLSRYLPQSRKFGRFHKHSPVIFRGISNYLLNVLQLLFSHAEIMTKFMDESLANLMTDFRVIGADRLNVFLIEHYVGRPR